MRDKIKAKITISFDIEINPAFFPLTYTPEKILSYEVAVVQESPIDAIERTYGDYIVKGELID